MPEHCKGRPDKLQVQVLQGEAHLVGERRGRIARIILWRQRRQQAGLGCPMQVAEAIPCLLAVRWGRARVPCPSTRASRVASTLLSLQSCRLQVAVIVWSSACHVVGVRRLLSAVGAVGVPAGAVGQPPLNGCSGLGLCVGVGQAARVPVR